MAKTVSLLAYADRLGGSIVGLQDILRAHASAFNGVHVLPFYQPFDGDDAGFDPDDHALVDPRLGDWGDVARLAGGHRLTADLIVNHTSSRSPQFLGWLAHGDRSQHAGLYLTYDRVFPEGATSADITAFYRPRPGLPFTPYTDASGGKHLVWTTFLPTQVDIDVTHPAGRAYLDGLLDLLAQHGVRTVRLDAIGYAIKQAGSHSFMTPATLDYVRELAGRCRARGLEVLVEVHAHFALQLEIAPLVDHIYDFALPPLLLHAWATGSTSELARWLDVRPPTAISVLDTHDGIGVVDACAFGPDAPGFLSDEQAAAIFARADEVTGGASSAYSVVPQFAPRPHQINSTFASVLGGDLESLGALRALQLLLPGPAHVYYVGLLGGLNDVDRAARTGVGREINRHHYSPDELHALRDAPIVRGTLALVRLVTTHPAVTGEFSWSCGPGRVELGWTRRQHRIRLVVDLGGGAARFELAATGDRPLRAASLVDLANLDGETA